MYHRPTFEVKPNILEDSSFSFKHLRMTYNIKKRTSGQSPRTLIMVRLNLDVLYTGARSLPAHPPAH
jgi:hypothetical protein